MYTLTELCRELSISPATGRNWIKLGKLKPEGKKGSAYRFSDAYVEGLKAELSNGIRSSLKSRRNKSFISGNALYNSYVSENSKNIPSAGELIASLDEKAEDYNTLLRILLSDCAIRMIKRDSLFSNDNSPIKEYLKGMLSLDDYARFVDDLLGDRKEVMAYIENHDIPSKAFVYEPGEDILGLLYISMKRLGSRKNTGSYYTPNKVIKRLLGHLFDIKTLTDGQSKRILDPCCGTGNFLLQLPPGLPAENIYGCDIDDISIFLSRINLALKYDKPDYDFWNSHIIKKNFLLTGAENNGSLFDNLDLSFDIVLGNPPWGYNFSQEEKTVLSQRYDSASGNNAESYDLFTEAAIRILSPGGTLSFVLPEAILNVKSHLPIRRILLKKTALSHLEYLGDVFDNVQCPSIILQISKLSEKEREESAASTMFLSKRPAIYEGEESYTIYTRRDIREEVFDFFVPDNEYAILESMGELPGARFLKDNAIFALGIVTGQNKDVLKSRKSPKNEIILKGSDLYKYVYIKPKCYISFDSKSYQQCAPTEYYRAPEKILYRFIANRLVFSYDNEQTLSLNSCNIVIPKLEGLKIKYVLAILNCRATEFFFRKKYRSVKILRSHIESLPIPNADERTQDEIISLVDKISDLCLITKKSEEIKEEIRTTYENLDKRCAALYGLASDDYQIIKNCFTDEGSFIIM
ncbi:MAG: N-6 DNA methylase [Butyrivibrio sp.]|nr:N-6 DNA methylase [Butyrivibrio sp.]